MKKIAIALMSAAIVCGFVSCQEKETYSELVPSDKLYLPRDNYPLDLSKGQSVNFEWKSSEEGMVVYQLLLDRQDGDFSSPLYVITSANNGVSPNVEVSNSVLRTVVDKTGALPGEVVNIRWTVKVFKGAEHEIYDTFRTLVLTVPDKLPSSVTLTGAAVENGNAVSMTPALDVHSGQGNDNFAGQAVRGGGEYECFIQVKPGEMTMTDDMDRYFVLEQDGKVSMGTEEASTQMTESGIFWLHVNFNAKTWTMKRIEKVEWWHSTWFNGNFKALEEMTYEGNGVWSLKDFAWQCGDAAGQHDTRYCFLCTYEDGTVEKWGHFSDDCRSNGNPDGTPGFYDIFRFDNGSLGEWSDTWKSKNDTEGIGQLATFTVYMNSDESTVYTHKRSFR